MTAVLQEQQEQNDAHAFPEDPSSSSLSRSNFTAVNEDKTRAIIYSDEGIGFMSRNFFFQKRNIYISCAFKVYLNYIYMRKLRNFKY